MRQNKGITKRHSAVALLLVLLLLVFSGCSNASEPKADNAANQSTADDTFSVAIAWSDRQDSYSFTSTLKTVEAAGAEPVVLDMVKSYDLEYDTEGNLVDAKDEHGALTADAAKLVKCNTWQNSNAAQVMQSYDCIIFPGGSDVSPSLYYDEQKWHGIEDATDYSAERDVSDYLLLSYCLEQDIPTLAICRGMQMLSVVSGADIIQDIPTWLKNRKITYTNMHKDPEGKDLVPHSIEVLTHDSLLYDIVKKDALDGCPSWHHQAVDNVDGTRLTVTAQAETDGVQMIEAVERSDKGFVIGLQFHPEVAVRKVIDKEENADDFMDYDTAISFFNVLIQNGQKEHPSDSAAQTETKSASKAIEAVGSLSRDRYELEQVSCTQPSQYPFSDLMKDLSSYCM